MTMHYGLLPRANRGVFAINELPDLASKVQVGLFNILQEGDVQIKGYPVRLRLDVAARVQRQSGGLHGARQDHHALKDRIGSEIRTHYPRTRREALAITAQEAWVDRGGDTPRDRAWRCRIRAGNRRGDRLPGPRRPAGGQAVGREPAPAHHDASRTSCRTPSDARSSAREAVAVPRVSDIYASLPSLTGQDRARVRGRAERRRTRGARARAEGRGDGVRRPCRQPRHGVRSWSGSTAAAASTCPIPRRPPTSSRPSIQSTDSAGSWPRSVPAIGARSPARASIADFILEGLCALKKISRTDDGRLLGDTDSDPSAA